MKNIHLLPTDKPSRIIIQNGNKLILGVLDYSIIENRQHIYITNDEEIKEGDWLFANQGVNKIVEIKEGNYPYGSINNKGDKIFNSKHWKSKIILTTDQDLIADGVQAIEDEFLEWFVKNPSCEEVEVNYIKTPSQIFIANDVPYGYYKIIIPQEEPNPFELPKALPDDVFFKSLEEPKQETLEEAFSKELKSKGLEFSSNLNPLDMFNLGVKWQSERMYSEEEVLDLLLTWRYTNHDLLSTKEWLEQFKKK